LEVAHMKIVKSLRKQKIKSKLKLLLGVALRIYGKVILILPIKRFKTAKSMDTKDYEKWYYGRPQAKEYLNNEPKKNLLKKFANMRIELIVTLFQG